jgi:hypothetical protein
MTENIALLHRLNDAVIQVQIGAADRGGSDSQNRIAGIDDLGVGDSIDLNLPFPMPA